MSIRKVVGGDSEISPTSTLLAGSVVEISYVKTRVSGRSGFGSACLLSACHIAQNDDVITHLECSPSQSGSQKLLCVLF